MDKLALVDIGGTFGSPFGQAKKLGDLVSSGISLAFVGAGVLFFIMIIWGGIELIQGSGKREPNILIRAKDILTYTFLGFIVIFVSYWIIRIFEEITGTPFITNPGPSF